MNNVKEELLYSHTLPSAFIEGMKRCSKCGEKKPFSEFNNRQSSRDGKQSYCRLCQEDDRLLRAYNLTREQRDLMYDRQQGKCPVCQGSYPQFHIYAFKGLGVLSLVCPRCMHILNNFNRNPDIITSAIAYLDYFRSKALYRVELRVKEDWGASQTGELPRKTCRRQYPRGVNPETYDHWSLLNEHTCYICGELCQTEQALAKDHNHSTDRNRALLCFLCNTTLGTAKEDIDLLHACATFLHAYLDLYIASLLWITDDMVADAEQELPWVSRAYSAVLPDAQRS
jgi:hypothetical protein